MREILIQIKVKPDSVMDNDKQTKITADWLKHKLLNDLIGGTYYEVNVTTKGGE